MNKSHIPHGDSFEIQTWDEVHDRWLVWSYADTWDEAQRGSDHARDHGISKGKVRIVRL